MANQGLLGAIGGFGKGLAYIGKSGLEESRQKRRDEALAKQAMTLERYRNDAASQRDTERIKQETAAKQNLWETQQKEEKSGVVWKVGDNKGKELTKAQLQEYEASPDKKPGETQSLNEYKNRQAAALKEQAIQATIANMNLKDSRDTRKAIRKAARTLKTKIDSGDYMFPTPEAETAYKNASPAEKDSILIQMVSLDSDLGGGVSTTPKQKKSVTAGIDALMKSKLAGTKPKAAAVEKTPAAPSKPGGLLSDSAVDPETGALELPTNRGVEKATEWLGKKLKQRTSPTITNTTPHRGVGAQRM